MSRYLVFGLAFMLGFNGLSQDNSLALYQQVASELKDCPIQKPKVSEECVLIEHLLLAFESGKLDEAKRLIDTGLTVSVNQDENIQFLLKLYRVRIFFMKGLLDETINQYETLLKMSTNEPSRKWYAERITQRLGDLYLDNQEFQKSIEFLTESIKADRISFHPKFQAKAFHNLGIAYLHLKNFDSAEFYLQQNLRVKSEMKDTVGLAIAYMNTANVYYNQYLDEQAIPLFIKGLEFAKLASDQKVLRNANLNMAVVEENRGDLKAALSYRKEYEKIQKELWDRDKVWELAEQEKEFEVNLKEKEIALQQAEIRTKSWQRNSALLFGLVAIVVLVLTGWAYRRIKQANLVIADQNQELSQLNATKNRLFSIVSHDLKSPVLALQKSQQRLAAGIENQPKEQIKEALEVNAESAAATYRLLNNLLHWSLEQSDQLSFAPEAISLDRLVDQVLYDYQAPLQQKQINLINEVGHTSFKVHVDLNLMKMVLRNLLDNAIKFTPEEGSIKISAIEKNQVILSISDSGSGIPPDKLKAMQSSIDGKGDFQSETGTGLGLVLSQSILKKHGGQLTVTSEHKSGTQVQVYLPTSMQVWQR